MTTPDRAPINLAELERLAKAATPGPWYMIGPPWNDHAGYVNAGSADPHGGRMVCDCACQRDSETGDVADAPNDWNDAAHIAAVSPDVVLRLVAALRFIRAGSFLADPEAWYADHGITDEATP